MRNLDHTTTIHACRIDHDFDNTAATLVDPDGVAHDFVSTPEQPNALLQAIQWAKADCNQRLDAKLGARRAVNEPSVERPVEQSEFDDEPTETESEGEA